ncbi:MAG: tRNA (adenosine(37)-N6)-threonylcarbamoyltransferase complex ATPase subunit type 1 TsaE [Bacteroidia bacterium]|nr:tRNA (adenosine(37)-N6)-threonylcarbamoyltransferase complex ATPase subunit type 1 TsaE [Bacteroidia bacterium]
MKQEFEINNIEELKEVIPEISCWIRSCNTKTILLNGSMGAGKTTLIALLMDYWGCIDTVSSPTFSLVNEYETENGQTIFHFDCYRIKDIEEAYNAGLEEYFYQNAFCFIEWSEKIEQLIPENFIEINILTKELKRYISLRSKSN